MSLVDRWPTFERPGRLKVVGSERPWENSRRFRGLRAGDEVNLRLRSELSRELGAAAATRIQELQANGVDRLPVRVVKAPLAKLLGPGDAVKVEAPDLLGTRDPTVYVRVEFLELPMAEPESETHAARRERIVEAREKRVGERERGADDRDRIADDRDAVADVRDQAADQRERKGNDREGLAER